MKNTLCKLLLLSIIPCLAVLAFGQADTAKPLTDSDVISMAKSGLPAQIISAKIHNSATAFDTSPNSLEMLKAAGVPNSVLLTMVNSISSATIPAKAHHILVAAKVSPPAAPSSAAPAMIETTKPVIEILRFQVRHGVAWPYDPKQIQLQTIAELQRKDRKHFKVVALAATSQPGLYFLHGKVLAWHPGNKAVRMFVGFGSGRETAKIHYWLTNNAGEKIFSHTDTIRAAFWGNAYASSAGQLAQPFADKIAQRLKHVKFEQF